MYIVYIQVYILCLYIDIHIMCFSDEVQTYCLVHGRYIFCTELNHQYISHFL